MLAAVLLLAGCTEAVFTTSMRNYMFGHSLILHEHCVTRPECPNMNVPIFLQGLAETAGYSYSMSGEYGFADQNRIDGLSDGPNNQWGISGVTPAWVDDGLPFADVDFNTVVLTLANFRQWFGPSETDPSGFFTPTAVEGVQQIFEWVHGAEATNVQYFIYENWPDMGEYTAAPSPDGVGFTGGEYPTSEEIALYTEHTVGDFHNWWIELHDAVTAEVTDFPIRMIPVGPIIFTLLTTTLADIPASDLYEDNAPHGEPTLYCLAALVTYMAMFQEPAPSSYVVPDFVNSLVSDRYASIVSTIWDELNNFNFPDGSSRVFPAGTPATTTEAASTTASDTTSSTGGEATTTATTTSPGTTTSSATTAATGTTTAATTTAATTTSTSTGGSTSGTGTTVGSTSTGASSTSGTTTTGTTASASAGTTGVSGSPRVAVLTATVLLCLALGLVL